MLLLTSIGTDDKGGDHVIQQIGITWVPLLRPSKVKG